MGIFDLPTGANPAKDTPVGKDEMGRTIYQAASGQTYLMPDKPKTPFPLPHPGQVDGPFQQAITDYPIIRDLGLQLKTSPSTSDNMLEYWPVGEPGDQSYPRPAGMSLDRPGVEIFSNQTRPIDVLGDVVSHELVNTDPVIKTYYEKFKNSLTDEQHQNLLGQYEYAKQNFGETRPYLDWLNVSGLPAYFRGYLFDQWPDSKQYYTEDQLKDFDNLMSYIKAPVKK